MNMKLRIKSIKTLATCLTVSTMVLATTIPVKANTVVLNESETPEKAQKEPNYTETVVSIPSTTGKYKIPAIITIPKVENEKKVPLVVMLHGTGSDKHEAGGGYDYAARAMAEAGLATIRFDFIGTGDSQIDYREYNFTTATTDTADVLAYAKTYKEIDAEHVGIMGWSQGGSIAMLVAGQTDDYQSVLTWAGATDLSGQISDKEFEKAQKDGFIVREFDFRTPLNYGFQWIQDSRNVDILKTFANSTAPVLAINGSKDVVVEPKNAELIAKASKNKQSTSYILEGADHTFNIFSGNLSAFEQLVDKTIEWFNSTLSDPFTSTDVMVKNEGREVPATLVVPKGEGKFPLVVMNHGFGGNRQEGAGFVRIAEELATKGIASIRMDFAGCGDSKVDFSGYSLSANISDSNASLKYALENAPIDSERLGIFGYSNGGRMSLMITDKEDNPYKAMVLLAPAAFTSDEERIKEDKENLKIAQTKGYVSMPWFGKELHIGAKNYEDSLASYKTMDNLAKKVETAVIYGTEDVMVTPEVAIKAAEKIDAEIVKIDSADHGYGFYENKPEVSKKVETTTADFFVKHLGK